jgi:hypothetical protein
VPRKLVAKYKEVVGLVSAVTSLVLRSALLKTSYTSSLRSHTLHSLVLRSALISRDTSMTRRRS